MEITVVTSCRRCLSEQEQQIVKGSIKLHQSSNASASTAAVKQDHLTLGVERIRMCLAAMITTRRLQEVTSLSLIRETKDHPYEKMYCHIGMCCFYAAIEVGAS